MPLCPVLHFGGNGHCFARVQAASDALEHRGVRLVDVPYPGFEGRSRASSLSQFLDDLANFYAVCEPRPRLCYASGIGGLIAFSLRALGRLETPMILQAPVLWGLRRRWFPRLMRYSPVRRTLQHLFSLRAFQHHFVARYFLKSPDTELMRHFFEGYARCSAFAQLFEWLSPSWLTELEARFKEHPERLRDISVWWGDQDHVIGVKELRETERVLGVQWPLVWFPRWGHYPMIEAPEEWANALVNELETARQVPQRLDP
jgi:pimeloyl-ACP methyl ester carboxylesterase